MARQPRLIIPNFPHYIYQSGHHNQDVFIDADDYHYFLQLLSDAAQKFFVQLHAYALMPSYVQLLAKPKDESGLAKMMQWIGRHYVPYFNLKYNRSGTIWEGRFKTSIVDPVQQIACGQYIELAPVLAQLNHQENYPWTSYLHHIGARHDAFITSVDAYWALGNTPFERELNYKKNIDGLMSSKKLKEIAQVLEKSGILAEVSFVKKLELQLGKSLIPQKRGRPAKIS